MRGFLLVVVAMVAWPAFAACDVRYTIEMTYAAKDGTTAKLVSAGPIIYYGVPKADAEDLHARGLTITNVASTVQDKGGPFSVVANEYQACDGGPEKASGGFEVRGVTIAGYARISRQALKVAADLVRKYEKRPKRNPFHDKD